VVGTPNAKWRRPWKCRSRHLISHLVSAVHVLYFEFVFSCFCRASALPRGTAFHLHESKVGNRCRGRVHSQAPEASEGRMLTCSFLHQSPKPRTRGKSFIPTLELLELILYYHHWRLGSTTRTSTSTTWRLMRLGSWRKLTGKVMSGPRNCHVNACQPRDSWHLGHPTCLKMMAKLPLIVLKRSRTGCRLRELRTMNPSNNQNFQSQLLEVDPYKNQHTCTPMLFPGPSAVDDQDHGEFTCEIC